MLQCQIYHIFVLFLNLLQEVIESNFLTIDNYSQDN